MSYRFVARFRNYSVGVQSEVLEHYGTGETKVLKKHVEASFRHGLLDDDAYAVALQSFKFGGLPEDFDTNQNVRPRFRCTVWDSEYAKRVDGLTDEEVEMVVEKLRQTAGPNHVELVKQKTREPFPNYDTFSEDEVLQLVDALRLDPAVVVEYERENQNRESLIGKLLAEEEETVVVEA